MSSTESRMYRVSHTLKIRPVTVTRIKQLSPGFISITFHSPEFADFVSASFDDHVKLILPGADGEEVRRDYTPLHYDQTALELTLEFALHEHGAATDWARQAQPGNQALIGGPRGSMVMPVDYSWQLLIGDATALPAIERRLQELPGNVQATVMVNLRLAEDRRDLASDADIKIHWVTNDAELLALLKTYQLPKGDGLIWAAGEDMVMAEVKQILRNIHQHPAQATRIASYWKRGSA